jgi:endonuclease YncB( thermonuclease family)
MIHSGMKNLFKLSEEEELNECSYKNCEKYVPLITKGKIVKCYDGDTVTIATIMEGKRVKHSVRMLGYDCAEIRSHDEQEKQVAKWAKEYINDLIFDKIVIVTKNDGYDKYGRLLLELKIGDTNVNEIMLEKWGVVYNGGHKDDVDWNMWSKDGRKKIL